MAAGDECCAKDPWKALVALVALQIALVDVCRIQYGLVPQVGGRGGGGACSTGVCGGGAPHLCLGGGLGEGPLLAPP